MTAITNDFAAKLAPIRAESWSAWKLGERESLPIALDAPDTLDAAVNQAMAGACWHSGDRLAIQYTHAGRNRNTLRLYGIKISAKRGVWRDSTNGGSKVWHGAPEAMLWAETAATFAPIEPFDAFRDSAVGADLTLVSQ